MLKQGLSSLFRELTTIDNVLGVGRGHKLVRGESTGEQSVIILVRKKLPRCELSRKALLPRKIDGLPTDVIEVGDIRLLSDRTQTVRPAQPGVSIGHFKVSAGTFGAVVRDRDTGERLILSNNHVLANATDGSDGRAVVGDPIVQPGIYDGGTLQDNVIGHLVRFVPLLRETMAPQCPMAKMFETLLNKIIGLLQPHYRIQVLRESEKTNVVDCAVAKPVNDVIIRDEIFEFGQIAGVKDAKVGMAVKKSGRSTGVTHSLVLATDVIVKVALGNREYGVFADQVLAGPMSMPGDSGALVLTEDNYAVGLLFAGSEQVTMFNRITNVLDALNIIF